MIVRLLRGTVDIFDFILANGEERLALIFFGAVDIPDDEWERRKRFRQELDSQIRKITKEGLRLPSLYL